MSDKYKIRDKDRAYFVTCTIVGWIDVFTRVNHKQLIIESLAYCQEHKGLTIFAYCIMPSHIHGIFRADGAYSLSDISRDFKTYTSKRLITLIKEEPESRREWMLAYFIESCRHLKRKQEYKVWQNGNHSEEIFSTKFLYQKLDYIHQNPVKDLIVEYPEDYLFSSARNYADKGGFLNIEVLPHKPLVINWK
ncbi:MAG: REP element-mobilizing transposase RayT [Salibacteraceae bacterium]|jgi:REP element-mobilizing transposase RayT